MKQLFNWLTSPRSLDSTVFPPVSDEELITYDWARIIERSMEQLGIADDSISVEIRSTGQIPPGLHCYSGFIKIIRWLPHATPILLVNLPLVDARIRREIKTFSQGKQAHFSGLWIHASAHMTDAPQLVLPPQSSPVSVL